MASQNHPVPIASPFSWQVRLLAGVSPMLFVLVLLSGCGSGRPEIVPVTGTVVWEDDGTPIANASVMFTPAEGRPSAGKTNEKGEFTLQSYDGQPGAIAGTHTVTVRRVETSGIKAEKPEGEEYALSGEIDPSTYREKLTTPRKYGDPKTSDITINVEPGMEPVRIELKRQP